MKRGLRLATHGGKAVSPDQAPIAASSESEGRELRLFRFSEDQDAEQFAYLTDRDRAAPSQSIREAADATRFVTIGSQIAPALKDFVQSAFGPVEIHVIDNENLRGFSRQFQPFSVIVAIFDDVLRAKRVLRQYKPLLANKLCYAMMTESTPKDRVALLRFGFDDVFDTRMKEAEVLVRIQAQLNRQLYYNAAIKDDLEFQQFCEENIEGQVYAAQMALLRQFYNNIGKVLRYRELASFDFHAGDFRLQSLSVRIHKLRKRLKNYRIRCVRGTGYVLERCDD
jgi:DNA-binding response OmpR family regulator